MVSRIGVINDLDEPERAMVEIIVAARHSGILGKTPEVDFKETCHLSKVTAAVRKLKNPRCSRQEEQNTFKLRS